MSLDLDLERTSDAIDHFKQKLADVLADVAPILGKQETGTFSKETSEYTTLFQLSDLAPMEEGSFSDDESSATDVSAERPSDAFVGVLS